MNRRRGPRVAALVEAGAAPGRNPVLRGLAEVLAGHGVALDLVDATVPWLVNAGSHDTVGGGPEADLWLLKGDHPAVLARAGILADGGARCLNDYDRTARAADKSRALAILHRAGVAVPATLAVADGDSVAHLLEHADGPRFVKPLRGAHGVGAGLLHPGERPPVAVEGPWLVQEVVTGDGLDVKVYGVAERCAVRRSVFSPGCLDGARIPDHRPDPALVRTAIAAAQALELTCWGVDLLIGVDGPVVVDVNAFPGYRTVDDAPGWLADAVLGELPTRARRTA